MSRLLKPRTIAYLLAFGVVAVLFAITLCWRVGLASEVTTARTEPVTAQIYFWLQNWIHDGAFSIHFTMPYLPLSIESPDLQFRSELYRSYPPGTLIPVYLQCRFSTDLHRSRCSRATTLCVTRLSSPQF